MLLLNTHFPEFQIYFANYSFKVLLFRIKKNKSIILMSSLRMMEYKCYCPKMGWKLKAYLLIPIWMFLLFSIYFRDSKNN